MSRSSSTFGDRAYRFYTRLEAPPVPRGIVVMNPYTDATARRYVRGFLDKYYDDARARTLVLGINPGRFGAGITGVTFTDPIALADSCGIANDLQRRHELSSIFVYKAIEAAGGPDAFFSRFFLTAISPLGFTRGGVNLNYYDVRELERRVTPFIVSSIEKQIAMGGRTDHAVVLGRGTNAKFLTRLNEEHRFFAKIHVLEHPRWIMQYRRKRVEEFVEAYARVFESVPPST